MVRKLTWSVAIAALAVVAAAQNPAPAAPSLTLDQVLAKHHQAQGGLEKIKAVKSVRLSGKVIVQGMELPFVREQKRPANYRMDVTVQGMSIVEAYDGKTGWTIMPLQGNKDPQPMGEVELKNAEEQADMDGALVDSQQKGHKVELVGKEPVEGTDAYKLKITLKNGDIRYVYLDADSFLQIRTTGKRMVRDTEMEFESNIGDYKEVEGMMFPFSIDQGEKGTGQRLKITVDKVEINPALDDARFKMPEVKKEEPKPPAKPGV